MNGLLVVELVKNAIATDQDVVKLAILANFKCGDVRFRHHDIRIAVQLGELSLDVAESSTD